MNGISCVLHLRHQCKLPSASTAVRVAVTGHIMMMALCHLVLSLFVSR